MNITNESQCVQTYLQMLQDVISRMATNSTNCKTWCMTLVSAVIVIVADKGHPEYVWIASGPVALFFYLDAYYLSLEKQYRDLYDTFVKKLQDESAKVEDIFVLKVNKKCYWICRMLSAAKSGSVWPFYVLLGSMLIAARKWIVTVAS